MKKILFFTILFCFFILPVKVFANSISNIDMDIYVDSNGDAYITEKWTAYVDQGTEGYKPYYNLGDATITNFVVSEDGVTYTSLDSWDINATFSEKAYKSGINYISDGLELCWGISEYGSHVYTLTYKISGFVLETTDSQIVYWTLIPYELSTKPSNVHIKIYSDFIYSDTLDVWGYGNYGGTAYVYDGYIEMNSDGALDSDEYMTILVKYPSGTFSTENIDTVNDFNYYYEMAEKGSTGYSDDYSSSSSWFSIFWGVIQPFLFIGLIIFFISLAKKSSTIGKYRLDFGKRGKKFNKDLPNYRDIPCKKDIYDAYFISMGFDLCKKKTDILGAILLKWLKEDKISTKKVTTKILKKEVLALDLKESTFKEPLEQELYDMMKIASKDGILEQNEFENWCQSNYNKILKWFDKLLNDTGSNLEEKEYLIKSSKGYNKYQVTDKMFEEADKLKG
ncbi:MAG TPA: DUF2207 domain-containing protein, partial [Bacilli bacterium]|nr:DUF2207 domain-containing protein [Bacilli bacterium]